jgi:hypothetical protein
MSEFPPGDHHESATPTESVSVPYLLLSAILAGVGLFGMAYWLVTFNWLYFASVIPLAVGAYMLFTRGTGPDRA